jgi:hypothetical protein
MAGRGPETFKKKQKEQQRREKRQEKIARKLERKRQARTEPDVGPLSTAAMNDPSISDAGE